MRWSPNAYQMVHNSFEQWWLVLIYFLALIAVGLHLRHGVWSAFATLGGANTSPNVRRNWNIVAWIVLLVIVVGFMVPPVAILLGVI